MMLMNSKKDIENWNAAASLYSKSIGADNFIGYATKHIWELAGDIKGKYVLDLGCGQGWLSRDLRARGSAVTGIDGSKKLLEMAKKQFQGIEFMEYDLSKGLPQIETKFDTIISHMTIMDIEPLDQLFESIPPALNDNGSFIFSILHPCFFNRKSIQDTETGTWFKKVEGYLHPEVWHIDNYGGHNHYHRSISYYFELLKRNRMCASDLIEPPHIGKSTTIPKEFIGDFPLLLIIRALKLKGT